MSLPMNLLMTIALAVITTVADARPVKLRPTMTVGEFADLDIATQNTFVAGAMVATTSTVMYCTVPLTPQFVRDSMLAHVRSGWFPRNEHFTMSLLSTLAGNGCHYEESVMGRLRIPS
jgi:hypothetical protein